MNAMNSLLRKLSPLKVYSITDKSNIKKELSAYCAALDAHRENLDTLLRECFISSAKTYGIEMREKLTGDVRSSDALSKRRNMLTLRQSINENDFTRAGLEKFLRCLGAEKFTIFENPSQYLLGINLGLGYSDSDKRWILSQLYLFLPAHLKVNVYINNEYWSNYIDDSKKFKINNNL